MPDRDTPVVSPSESIRIHAWAPEVPATLPDGYIVVNQQRLKDAVDAAIKAERERADGLAKVIQWVHAMHVQDGNFPWCAVCGAEGGRWPCATRCETTEALKEARTDATEAL